MITDAQARRIACEWHVGGGSALYALACCGIISTATVDELVSDLRVNHNDEQEALLTYVRHQEVRDFQPGWHLLWSEEPVTAADL